MNLKGEKDRINRAFSRGTLQFLLTWVSLLIPLYVLVLGFVSVLLLQFGQLHTWVAIALSFLLWLLFSWVLVKPSKRTTSIKFTKSQSLATLLVLVFISIWMLFNAGYASQSLFFARDPGLYANTALWLENNDSLDFEAINHFGDDYASLESSGFEVDDNGEVFAFSSHMLPALLGLGARFVGSESMFHLSVLIGGAALLALFSLAIRILKPFWAVISVLITSFTLPFLYFSRDSFTEPLAMMGIFLMLGVVWLASKKGGSKTWFVAGLVTGMLSGIRIDSYFAIAAAILGAGLYLATSLSSKHKLKQNRNNFIAFLVGTVSTAIVGLLDVVVLSVPYFQFHKKLFIILLLLTALVSVCMLLLFNDRLRIIIKDFSDKHRHLLDKLPHIGAIVLGVIFAVLVSRPLWLETYGTKVNLIVLGTQRSEGLPLDGTRSYAELTVNWLGIYIGIVLLAMGLSALIFYTFKLLKGKNKELLPFYFVVLSSMLLYLSRPSITPDQVWASRRFVPVVIAGIVLFGLLATQRLLSWFQEKYPELITKQRSKTIAVIVALLLLAQPLWVSWPFMQLQAKSQYSTAQQMCDSLKADSNETAIIWVGFAGDTMLQTTRSVCSLPSSSASISGERVDINEEILRQYYANSIKDGKKAIIATFSNTLDLFSEIDNPKFSELAKYSYDDIEKRLVNVPRKVVSVRQGVIIAGEITAEGNIVPLQYSENYRINR